MYFDQRPQASHRLPACDQGLLLPYGQGPEQCDYLGMREALINQVDGVFYLYYDGAGPRGWLACLAVSKDLKTWDLRGPVLDFGAPGEIDSGTATSPWIVNDGQRWHMFYVACRGTTPPPDCIPSMPYFTRKASAPNPFGPWTKQPAVTPFDCLPGTYYAETASPGHIIRLGDEWLMFFSAARPAGPGEGWCPKRTLGIARTRDLDGPWTPDADPIVPSSEQIENSSLYFDAASATWYLFTNHIGMPADGPNQCVEFTDAIWVYWSQDLEHWDAANKAVVLDGANCNWSRVCIGLPSVTRVGDRLALFYDAPGGDSASHMRRSIGLAWLELPLSGVGSSSRKE